MNLFKKLFSSLNGKSVKYMVVGGVAVNLYGIERSTADIDLMVVLDQENLTRLVDAVKELGLIPKMPVQLEELIDADKRKGWVLEKQMRVFTVYDSKNPFFLLDVLIDHTLDFDALYAKRTTIDFDGISVPVIHIEDLVHMKEQTGRPQDKADAFYLRKIIEGWQDEE